MPQKTRISFTNFIAGGGNVLMIPVSTMAVTLLGIWIICGPLDHRLPEFAPLILFALIFAGALAGSIAFFHPDRWADTTLALSLAELEAQGLIVTTDYHCSRAIQVEAFEDEGVGYFLEVQNGEVLFLQSQELDDYAEWDDFKNDDFHERRFPCTEFQLKRHKESGEVRELILGGSPLEPEGYVSYSTWNDVKFPNVQHGDILHGVTFDDLIRTWRFQ